MSETCSVPVSDCQSQLNNRQNHGKATWPKIFRLFADYAPIQATSVPSERVFSSSAETDTKRRNRTSALLMEALQMLKFNYKKLRLNFMSDWQTAPVADDDEDWLRTLADSHDQDRDVVWREIVDSCDAADGIVFTEMPEENE
jgi:hypothetical protein